MFLRHLLRFCFLLAVILPIGCDKPHAKPPGPPTTRFSLSEPKAKAVFLAGEFNNWNTTATPMKSDGAGQWTVELPLRPGTYEYKFVIDGRWQQDVANPAEAPDQFGGKNSLRTVPDPTADPVVADKGAVKSKARQLFAKSDYAGLEATARELRASKARFSDGLWKLSDFYGALEPNSFVGDKDDWKPWFDKMEAWKTAFPESITQPVVLAQGFTGYAWKARGSGWGYTITEEGAKLFDDRITRAQQVLETAAKLPARCPNWFVIMQTVALAQGWPRDKYLELVAEAAKTEPTFYNYYASGAYFLLPRWYGEAGDWERFAEDTATKFDPAEGMAAYTRTAWFTSSYYNNLFKETAIAWPKMKQGFFDIEKAYPNSRWNLNGFCRFAVMAGDRATVHALIARIGDQGDPNWESFGRYELAKQWADPATPEWRIKPAQTLQKPFGKPPPVHSIAFSPNGKLLVSGDDAGHVTLWNPQTGAAIWSFELSKDPVAAVAISADGKMIAAGGGEEHKTTHPGVAKLWNIETREEIGTVTPKTGAVFSVTFTPDNKTLVVGGGEFNRHGEASLWDIATKTARPMPWAAEHTHVLRGIAVSPDSKVLATGCNKSITVWSMAENKMLFDTQQTQRTFIRAMTFSPDGGTAAGAGEAAWEHHNWEPGGLVFWDTKTWKERTPREQDDAGSLFAVAFSPDGKLIAGGGQDQGVHVWNAATLESKTTYIGHDGIIWSVAFSPDGKTVASGSEDGTIKIWTLPP